MSIYTNDKPFIYVVLLGFTFGAFIIAYSFLAY